MAGWLAERLPSYRTRYRAPAYYSTHRVLSSENLDAVGMYLEIDD